MRFALLVALSHLRGRRHTAGVSAIGLVSVIGVTVGVTALIMVLAVMEGFEVDLRQKILGSNAHVVVLHYDGYFADYRQTQAELAAVDGVAAVAPFVYSEAMVQGRFGSAGVIVKGMDLSLTTTVTDVQDNLVLGPRGALSELVPTAPGCSTLWGRGAVNVVVVVVKTG